MHTIKQDYTIKAPISEVWKALTEASMAEQWGAGPAKLDANEGGEFSYWGGDIHGTNTKIETEKRLEQDWYGHNYPDRCYKVTFIFEVRGENETTVRLVQTDVPDEELTDMTEGWPDYYFDPIKKLLEK